MNQCRRYRHCNAAMVLGKLVERRNGIRIAQHHGYLPTTCHAGGLALGAGLGLGHGSGKQRPSFDNLSAREQRTIVRFRIAVKAAQHGRLAELANGGRGGGLAAARAAHVVGTGGNGGGFCDVHGYLRGWPIQPMCESYIVTSDASTPFDCAMQEAA